MIISRWRRRRIAVLVAAAATLAGCATTASTPTADVSTSTTSATPEATPPPGPVIDLEQLAARGVVLDVCRVGVDVLPGRLSADGQGVTPAAGAHPLDGSPSCAWTGPLGSAMVTLAPPGYFVPPAAPTGPRGEVHVLEEGLGREAVVDLAATSVSWLRDNMSVTLTLQGVPVTEADLIADAQAIDLALLVLDAELLAKLG